MPQCNAVNKAQTAIDCGAVVMTVYAIRMHIWPFAESVVPMQAENMQQSFINTETVLHVMGQHWADFVSLASVENTRVQPIKAFYGISQGGVFGAGYAGTCEARLLQRC